MAAVVVLISSQSQGAEKGSFLFALRVHPDMKKTREPKTSLSLSLSFPVVVVVVRTMGVITIFLVSRGRTVHDVGIP